jgi:predicted subunit of tRNA(5-methylaminomethyl-2-thiouridylate) methyltransferase
MTPAQFFSAYKRVKERQKAEDYRTGLITCVMRKLMGDKKAEPFDFFPEHKQDKKKSSAQRRREFQQQLLAAAQAAKRS